MSDGWHEQGLIDRRDEAILVPRLFLAGEEASLVGAADSRHHAQEHHHHHQYSQHNPDNIDVICGSQSTSQPGWLAHARYVSRSRAYRFPSAVLDTRRILRRSSPGSSIRPRLLSWRRWISAIRRDTFGFISSVVLQVVCWFVRIWGRRSEKIQFKLHIH